MLLSKILQKFLKKKIANAVAANFLKINTCCKSQMLQQKKTYGGTSALMVEKEKQNIETYFCFPLSRFFAVRSCDDCHSLLLENRYGKALFYFLLFGKYEFKIFTVYCPKGGGWVSMKNLNVLRPSGTSYFFFVSPMGGSLLNVLLRVYSTKFGF